MDGRIRGPDVTPVTILDAGMVTSVGFNAPASCAAIRVGITGFVETHFLFAGEWLLGGSVFFERPWQGREKLLHMIVPAIEECIKNIDHISTTEIPLILCVAEPDRSGRFPDLDERFLREVQARMDKQFHPASTLIANGRIGGVQGVDQACKLIAEGWPFCVVAGVDSFLTAETLAAYNKNRRLQTADNSDGFIPGEAGAAVLLGSVVQTAIPHMQCLGTGYGEERATIDSEEPLRSDGLVQAFTLALADSGKKFQDLDYRITDISGEQYGFKEAALVLNRLLRVRKEEFDIWHPSDCIGEVGAAIVPIMLGIALTAAQKGYAPGPGVLCHVSSDTTERAAMILRYTSERSV
jgi:3-oxoacyl-[acyl-carrier-protein] synthase-1